MGLGLDRNLGEDVRRGQEPGRGLLYRDLRGACLCHGAGRLSGSGRYKSLGV